MAHSPYPSENQLADLVEAATAAAGQDAAWSRPDDSEAGLSQRGHHYDSYAEPRAIGESPIDGMGQQHFHPNTRNSMHESEHMQPTQPAPTSANPRKRKRVSGAPSTPMSANQFENPGIDFRDLPTQGSLSEARSAGVHSAAALFRRPSETSKKYTRPPMSKLFTSLELSPENFLHLQAAAKAFMLDDAHPDRRDTVGQRGRGDSEMVKLRLYNCVKHFLEGEGYGERFFGEHAVNEGMEQRELLWPRDQHRIISLVMPLLRRMVTNERQRQYAVETRKGGGDEKSKEKTGDEEAQAASTPSAPGQLVTQSEQEAETASVDPGLDPDPIAGPVSMNETQLEQLQAATEPSNSPRPDVPRRAPPAQRRAGRPSRRSAAATTPTVPPESPFHAERDPNAIILHINVVSPGDVRILPRFDLPSSLCPNLDALAKHIYAHAWEHSGDAGIVAHWNSADPWSTFKLKVWLADGMVPVHSDGEWMVALLSAGTKDWMDGELRVIVEVP